MALIELKNLYKTYFTESIETKVLFDVSVRLEKGEFVSIMGPSGSGKSTLMHIMGLLDTATSGTYLFNGKDVSSLSEEKLAHLRNEAIGFVFQAFFLLPRATVFDNVMLPLQYDERNGTSEGKKKAAEAIANVGLSHRIDYQATKLSGGEKQRVAIARALVNNPDIIFADEPTGNLDSKSGNQIMFLLQELHRKGHTIVMVTHERTTSEHAERIIHIKDGRIDSDTKVENRRVAKEATDLAK